MIKLYLSWKSLPVPKSIENTIHLLFFFMDHKLIKSLFFFLASFRLSLKCFETKVFIIGLKEQIKLLIKLFDELLKTFR
jgi:hypothetical protein